MNKNMIIAVLAVLSLVMLVFGFVQQAAAKKALIVAEMNFKEAETQRALANKKDKEAMLYAESARAEAENARRCEAECAKKK